MDRVIDGPSADRMRVCHVLSSYADSGRKMVALSMLNGLDSSRFEQKLVALEGSPWENGYVESFNGKLRDELLNRELFLRLPEARYVLDEWREYYNERRPHSGLNWQTPTAFAESVAGPPVGAAPLPTIQSLHKSQPILSYHLAQESGRGHLDGRESIVPRKAQCEVADEQMRRDEGVPVRSCVSWTGTGCTQGVPTR